MPQMYLREKKWLTLEQAREFDKNKKKKVTKKNK